MKITSTLTLLLCLLCLLLCHCVALPLKAPEKHQETILTIQEVTAFERNTGKPYWIITNRVLKRKLKYEVERILND